MFSYFRCIVSIQFIFVCVREDEADAALANKIFSASRKAASSGSAHSESQIIMSSLNDLPDRTEALDLLLRADSIDQALASEHVILAGIGVAWRILVVGVILNGLLCHISQELMLQLQHNPWTVQLNQLFGTEAQNFQTLNFAFHHQSSLAKATHYLTIPAEFIAWAYVIRFSLGTASCVSMLVLVLVQAVTSRFVPLIVLTASANLLTLAAVLQARDLPMGEQLIIQRAMQCVILCGASVRVLGHFCARGEKASSRPSRSRHDSTSVHARNRRRLPFNPRAMALTVPHTLFAEASAGMPLRLLVPMLNSSLGCVFESEEPAPNTNTAVEDPAEDPAASTKCAVGKEVENRKESWMFTRPPLKRQIESAQSLEFVPEWLPGMFLPVKWFWFI